MIVLLAFMPYPYSCLGGFPYAPNLNHAIGILIISAFGIICSLFQGNQCLNFVPNNDVLPKKVFVKQVYCQHIRSLTLSCIDGTYVFLVHHI